MAQGAIFRDIGGKVFVSTHQPFTLEGERVSNDTDSGASRPLVDPARDRKKSYRWKMCFFGSPVDDLKGQGSISNDTGSGISRSPVGPARDWQKSYRWKRCFFRPPVDDLKE